MLGTYVIIVVFLFISCESVVQTPCNKKLDMHVYCRVLRTSIDPNPKKENACINMPRKI